MSKHEKHHSVEYLAQEFAFYISGDSKYSHISRNKNTGYKAELHQSRVDFEIGGNKCSLEFLSAEESCKACIEIGENQHILKEPISLKLRRSATGRVSGISLRDIFEREVIPRIKRYCGQLSKQ